MLEKFKPAIIFFCVIAVAMILYLPRGWDDDGTVANGYQFLFYMEMGDTIYVTRLFFQLLMLFFLSIIFHFGYEHFRNKKR